MKRKHVKSLIIVGSLLVITGVAMGSLNGNNPFITPVLSPGVGVSSNHFSQPPISSGGNGNLVLSGHLVQDKIFSGGDGTVSLSLTMQADEVAASDQGETQPLDMVIVLDQSGSMNGQKIEYARQAILELVARLSAKDRIAIIGYADNVRTYSGLIQVTDANRERLQGIIRFMSAGGSTNLGAGLQEGINTLLANRGDGNLGKVILISDGLANRGIIHPEALGNIASIATEEIFSVSTVGVGHDFNEQLLAAIADRGIGNYYYLANPQAFAEVFDKEFQNSRIVAAHAIELRVPLPKDVSLLKAAGYPVTINDNYAIVRPGELLSGQTRKLFLTLKIPTHAEDTYELSGITARYVHKGNSYTATLPETFRVACVPDPNVALASIEQSEWEEKVLQEDFNTLREQVAIDLKNGKKEKALNQIDQYDAQQQLLNKEVGSTRVTTHLNEELDKLRGLVRQTFEGSRQEIEQQQKANAKDLQFRGYNKRRSK